MLLRYCTFGMRVRIFATLICKEHTQFHISKQAHNNKPIALIKNRMKFDIKMSKLP